MAESTVTKSNVFKEDLALATGASGAPETGTRRTSTGGTVTLTKIDLTHLQFPTGFSVIDYSTFHAAKDALGSSVGMINVMGDIDIADDYTVPANITVRMNPSCTFNIATTKTLTLNGPLEAGPQQIFACTGTGKVVMAAGTVKEIYAEWWATNTTPGTTDMSAAILAAYTAARDVDRGIVRLLANQYAVADLVLPQCTNGDGVMIAGAGPNNTKFVPAATHTAGNPLVTLAGTHAAGTDGIYLRDFQINGGSGDTNGLLIQPSNNCRIEDVTIVACSGIGFEAQRPYDLYVTRLRVYGCGNYDDSEPGVLLRKDPLTNAWGNQVYWNQCDVEVSAYRQMEIKGLAGMDAHGGKIHGKATTDSSSPEESLELLYIDGMSGWGKFIGVHFTHAHYANAVHITDDHGLTPGLNLYSVASFIGCDFGEISSYDTGALAIDGIYFDAGDVESALRVLGCRFAYHATGLGTGGAYIHLSANAHAWSTNVGGNQTREQANEFKDDRISTTRAGGFRAVGIIPDVLSLGTDQDIDLTIASDAVTLTSSLHYINTESDAASDDLSTVNGLTRRGTVVIVRAKDTDHTVVVKHGVGNIVCQGGSDITLDSTGKAVIFVNLNGLTWWAIGG